MTTMAECLGCRRTINHGDRVMANAVTREMWHYGCHPRASRGLNRRRVIMLSDGEKWLVSCFLLIAAALSILCALGSCVQEEKKRAWMLTPAGHRYVLESRAGIDEGWYTEAQAAMWLDAQVEVWVAQHPDWTPDDLRNRAYRYGYILVDDYMFAIGGPTTWAAGLHDKDEIKAAIWNHGQRLDPPIEGQGPPRLWRWSERTQSWWYGVLNEPAIDVIPHELDHDLYGAYHE